MSTITYETYQLVDSGGLADVHLGCAIGQEGVRRCVAIKQPGTSAPPDFDRALATEASIQAALLHPNVVRVEALASINGRMSMVMEFVHALSLEEIISMRSQEGEDVGPELAHALHIVARVADALAAAHALGSAEGGATCHGGLRPRHVLVDEDGGVKVLGFGRGQVVTGEHGRGEAGDAPERGRRPGGPQADVYALGMILYALCVGRQAPTLPASRRDHDAFVAFLAAQLSGGPPELSRLFVRMVAHDPVARPTADEVCIACDELVLGLHAPPFRVWARPLVLERRGSAPVPVDLLRLRSAPAQGDTADAAKGTPWPLVVGLAVALASLGLVAMIGSIGEARQLREHPQSPLVEVEVQAAPPPQEGAGEGLQDGSPPGEVEPMKDDGLTADSAHRDAEPGSRPTPPPDPTPPPPSPPRPPPPPPPVEARSSLAEIDTIDTNSEPPGDTAPPAEPGLAFDRMLAGLPVTYDAFCEWLPANPHLDPERLIELGVADPEFGRTCDPSRRPHPGSEPVAFVPALVAAAYCQDRGGLPNVGANPQSWSPRVRRPYELRERTVTQGSALKSLVWLSSSGATLPVSKGSDANAVSSEAFGFSCAAPVVGTGHESEG